MLYALHVWRCEPTCFVWELLCILHTFSFSHASYVSVKEPPRVYPSQVVRVNEAVLRVMGSVVQLLKGLKGYSLLCCDVGELLRESAGGITSATLECPITTVMSEKWVYM